MKVGDKIWQIKGEFYSQGKSRREKWQQVEIVGETTRSWLVGLEWNRIKIAKKGPRDYRFLFSQKELDDDVWFHDNRYYLERHIAGVQDIGILRQVAALVGYKDRPK
jgi:hypothetical protein